MTPPLDRLRRTLAPGVTRGDAALAGALALLCLAQVLVVLPIGPRGVGAVVALGSTLPVAWRRVRPVEAAIAGSTAWLIPTDGFLLLGYVVACLLFGSLGLRVARWSVIGAVAGFGVIVSVAAAAQQHLGIGEYAGGILIVLAPIAFGRFLRHERERNRRLEELTLHLERERELGARAAVAEERARVARELHDIVAHGVSVIAIQSDAAEAALDRDAQLARAPLQAINASAKDALADMRRLLGVLREDGEEHPAGADRGPLPGLADAPALVERARTAGVPVELQVDGEPRPVPASLDLAAYRIVQEALTNVRKHAPGAPTAVRLGWTADALEVAVRNAAGGPPANGRANGGGHGLLGMRERVRAHGGTLSAAPRDGGFEVRATLPLGDRG